MHYGPPLYPLLAESFIPGYSGDLGTILIACFRHTAT